MSNDEAKSTNKTESVEVAKVGLCRLIMRFPDGTETAPLVLRNQVASGTIGAREFDASFAMNGDMVVYLAPWKGLPSRMYSVSLRSVMDAIVAHVASENASENVPPEG